MSEGAIERAAPRRARLASFRPHLPTSILGRLTLTSLPVIGFIGVWWLVALSLDRPRIYPPPDVVFATLAEIIAGRGELGSAYVQIGATMYRLIAAFLASLILGTVLGIVAGRIRLAFDLLDNVSWIFMAVPAIVWVYLFAIVLGITDLVPIVAISALLTPMVLLNVAEGAKSIPVDIVEMATSYKASRLQRIAAVYLPYLVPYIASSARVTFGVGIKIVWVAEVVGLTSGIGYEVSYWHDSLFMGPIAAWGIVMIAIGLIADHGIFRPLERKMYRWKGKERLELAGARIG